jgi:acyl carrier protein
LAPIFASLVRTPIKRATHDGGALAKRLAEAPPEERDAILLELVTSNVAAVLGHSSAEQVDAGRAFKELGFDSLSAVELRNRLQGQTGLRLPSTLVFDYPTAQEVAGYLRGRLSPDGDDGQSGETEIRQAIASIPISRLQSTGLLGILLELAGVQGDGEEAAVESDEGAPAESAEQMDVESLVQKALGGTETPPESE